jgi:broad specificity phosphatase PhoE
MPANIVRGMINVPLAPQGQQEAEHFGQRLAAKGGVDSVVYSPLDRARATAQAVLKHNPQARDLGPDPGLLPMAQGGLEGHDMKHVDGALRHFADNPDLPIPGVGPSGAPGESVASTYKRKGEMVKRHLASMRHGERRLAIGHHTDIRYLKGLAKKGFPPSMEADPKEMAGEGADIKPAKTLVRLAKKGGKPYLHNDDIDSDAPIRPGLTFATHGATMLNKEGGGSGAVLGRLRR